MTSPEQVKAALQDGVNAVGIIFVPQSKRYVKDITIAKEIVGKPLPSLPSPRRRPRRRHSPALPL